MASATRVRLLAVHVTCRSVVALRARGLGGAGGGGELSEGVLAEVTRETVLAQAQEARAVAAHARALVLAGHVGAGVWGGLYRKDVV